MQERKQNIKLMMNTFSIQLIDEFLCYLLIYIYVLKPYIYVVKGLHLTTTLLKNQNDSLFMTS